MKIAIVDDIAAERTLLNDRLSRQLHGRNIQTDILEFNSGEEFLNAAYKAFDKNNLRDILSQMIDSFINTHTMKKEAHEELMAMSHLDEKVGELFNQNELKMTENISNLLINNDMNIKNVEEKVHIIMGLVDNYCHEVVYHHHKKLNYDIMREEVLDTILFILNKD